MGTMTTGQQQCEEGRGEVPTFLPWLLSFDIAWTKTGQASNSPILPEPSFAEEHREIPGNEDWERWPLWDIPLPQETAQGISDCYDTGISHSYALSHPQRAAREGPAGPVLMPVLTVATGTDSSKPRSLETQ